MKDIQRKTFLTLVENNFHVTRSADKLNLVQSALSRHIYDMEEVSGQKLFTRQGKKLIGLTKVGEEVLEYAIRIESEQTRLKSYLETLRSHQKIPITLATTHTQAKYILIDVLGELIHKHKNIDLSLIQSSPEDMIQNLRYGKIDMVLCTENIPEKDSELRAFNCFDWSHIVIVQQGHPLCRAEDIRVEHILDYPIITYTKGFTGRSLLDKALESCPKKVNIAISATDSDIIKTYVQKNWGVGIVSSLAYQENLDTGLVKLSVKNLNTKLTTRLAIHKNSMHLKYAKNLVALIQNKMLEK